MKNQNSKEIIPLFLSDIAVKQFFNLTAQDLFYYLIAFNVLLNVLGFGLGQFLGENLILLVLFFITGFSFLFFAFFQVSFVNKFVRAHHITMKRQKRLMQRNKLVFVNYNYLEPNKYWAVIAASLIIFLFALGIGIHRTSEQGLKNFNEMVKTSKQK